MYFIKLKAWINKETSFFLMSLYYFTEATNNNNKHYKDTILSAIVTISNLWALYQTYIHSTCFKAQCNPNLIPTSMQYI